MIIFKNKIINRKTILSTLNILFIVVIASLYFNCTGFQSSTIIVDVVASEEPPKKNSSTTEDPEDLENTKSCTLNETTILHGNTIQSFRNSSPHPLPCQRQDRLCDNGKLSGSYVFDSCSPAAGTAQECQPFNGKILKEGESTKAYTLVNGVCVNEDRICSGGILSGSYIQASCSDSQENNNCSFVDQDGSIKNIPLDSSIETYADSSVNQGDICRSSQNMQVRTCVSDTLNPGLSKLDGSYKYGSCDGPLSLSCNGPGELGTDFTLEAGFNCTIINDNGASNVGFTGRWNVNGQQFVACDNTENCLWKDLSYDQNDLSVQVIGTDIYGNEFVTTPLLLTVVVPSELKVNCDSNSDSSGQFDCDITDSIGYSNFDWQLTEIGQPSSPNISVDLSHCQASCRDIDVSQYLGSKSFSIQVTADHTSNGRVSSDPVTVLHDPPIVMPNIACDNDVNTNTLKCRVIDQIDSRLSHVHWAIEADPVTNAGNISIQNISATSCDGQDRCAWPKIESNANYQKLLPTGKYNITLSAEVVLGTAHGSHSTTLSGQTYTLPPNHCSSGLFTPAFCGHSDKPVYIQAGGICSSSNPKQGSINKKCSTTTPGKWTDELPGAYCKVVNNTNYTSFTTDCGAVGTPVDIDATCKITAPVELAGSEYECASHNTWTLITPPGTSCTQRSLPVGADKTITNCSFVNGWEPEDTTCKVTTDGVRKDLEYQCQKNTAPSTGSNWHLLTTTNVCQLKANTKNCGKYGDSVAGGAVCAVDEPNSPFDGLDAICDGGSGSFNIATSQTAPHCIVLPGITTARCGNAGTAVKKGAHCTVTTPSNYAGFVYKCEGSANNWTEFSHPQNACLVNNSIPLKLGCEKSNFIAHNGICVSDKSLANGSLLVDDQFKCSNTSWSQVSGCKGGSREAITLRGGKATAFVSQCTSPSVGGKSPPNTECPTPAGLVSSPFNGAKFTCTRNPAPNQFMESNWQLKANTNPCRNPVTSRCEGSQTLQQPGSYVKAGSLCEVVLAGNPKNGFQYTCNGGTGLSSSGSVNFGSWQPSTEHPADACRILNLDEIPGFIPVLGDRVETTCGLPGEWVAKDATCKVNLPQSLTGRTATCRGADETDWIYN